MSVTSVEDRLLGEYMSHRPQLHALATRLMGCRWKGEEIVQEAYLRMTADTAARDIQRPFQFLWSVVYRLSIDAMRRETRDPLSLRRSFATPECRDELHEREEKALADMVTPERDVVAREHMARMSVVLQQLPAQTRRAFELVQIQGYSQKEVAKMLNVSAPYVNKIVKNASRVLDECLIDFD